MRIHISNDSALFHVLFLFSPGHNRSGLLLPGSSYIKKRVMGIEPTYPAWKAGVLPLNYTRIYLCCSLQQKLYYHRFLQIATIFSIFQIIFSIEYSVFNQIFSLRFFIKATLPVITLVISRLAFQIQHIAFPIFHLEIIVLPLRSCIFLHHVHDRSTMYDKCNL